ncbi:MAG: hypothetical protein JO202_01275 [Ktedonobacteraceae bacterium]|nr:hypothetical protein [Ktedonobacteraceae bacterium]
MPQSPPPKAYMTASEVKEMLGITDGKLYNYVDNGALERIFPPGRKQGVYRRSQVEQLARDLQAFISTRDEGNTTFRKATKEDIPICLEIWLSSHPRAQRQETTATLETRLAWLDKNPDLYYVVEHNNNIVGFTGVLPLKPERVQEVLDEERLVKDIKPEEIQEFKPGNPLHIYIITMRTRPNISRSEKRAYGARLMGGLITIFIELIDKGITIDTLYANSESVDGIRLLKHMHFTEVPSTTSSKNYILKMNSPEAQEILQKYKYAFITRKQTKRKLQTR